MHFQAMKWRLCCLTPSWENGINTLGQALWGMFVQSPGSGVTFTEERLAYTEKGLVLPISRERCFHSWIGVVVLCVSGSGLMSLDAWTSSHGPRATLPPHSAVPSPGLSPVPEMFLVTLTDCCHLQKAQAACQSHTV